MSLHALQKKLAWLFGNRRQQSPSRSPSGQRCAAGASELSDKVRGRLRHEDARRDLRRCLWYFKGVGIDRRDQQRRTPLHLTSVNGHADVVRPLAGKSCQLNLADNLNITLPMKGEYTPLNLAVSKQHEEMLECLLKKAADGHAAEQCERTARVVATSHKADLEEDNLRLHKKLERIEVELRELEEKYLNSEHCVWNLMAVLDEKEREELAAAQELQDQLSAYFENQTTVKQLEEHVQRLETKNTRLEAAVQQQSKRIEVLLGDLQASASLRELEEKYLNSEHCVWNLMAALDEKERETTASALKLQDQLSAYLETVKQLEEHVQCLGFEKTILEATIQQQSNKIEALQRDLQVTISAQAASQDFIKQSRASQHDSLTNQLKDRIRNLECELDRIKDTQQESTFQKQCTQAEVEKYKKLYLKEVKFSKCQAKELERANERLEEANAKLLRERHKNKSLITSSIVSGGLTATPVLYSTALGHLGNNLGLNRSLSLGESFLSQCEKILLSRKRLANSVAKVRQELDEKITKELKEATAELETGYAGSSKNLNVDQDPLCRAIKECRDVLTKNYLIK